MRINHEGTKSRSRAFGIRTLLRGFVTSWLILFGDGASSAAHLRLVWMPDRAARALRRAHRRVRRSVDSGHDDRGAGGDGSGSEVHRPARADEAHVRGRASGPGAP